MRNLEQHRHIDISGTGEIYPWPEAVYPFRNFFTLTTEEIAEFRNAVAANAGNLRWFVHTEYVNDGDFAPGVRPFIERYRERIIQTLGDALTSPVPVIAAIEVPPGEPDRLRTLRNYAARYRQLGDPGDHGVIVIPTYGGSHVPAPYLREPRVKLRQSDLAVWDWVGSILKSCGVKTVTLAGRNLIILNQRTRLLAEPIQVWWNKQHHIPSEILNFPVIAGCVGLTMAELECRGFQVELSPATFLYPGRDAGRKEFFPWLLE